MAKLHQFVKKSAGDRLLRGIIGDKTYDQIHPIGTALVKAATPVTPPPVVPLPDEEDIARAKRRSSAAQLQRGGRDSTILTGNSDRLGP